MELIPSSGGAFEITVNGVKVYSKLETGKYPTANDIITVIDRKASK